MNAPVGVVPPDVVGEVKTTVAINLHAKTVLAPGIALAPSAFDVHRGQYFSTEILQTLAAAKHDEWERVLGIVDVD